MKKPPKMSAYQKLHHGEKDAESKDERRSKSDQRHSVDVKKKKKSPLCPLDEHILDHSGAGKDSHGSNIDVSSAGSKNDNEEDVEGKTCTKPTIKSRSGAFVETPEGRDQGVMMNNKAYDDSEDGCVEDTIITPGARLALFTSARDTSVETTSSDDGEDGDDDGMSAEASRGSESDNETENTEDFHKQRDLSGSDDSEPSRSKATSIQAPRPEQVPDWFPKNIKKIYKIDHRGGALTFKELDEMTRYRASLQITHRRKWKKYIEAGQARWKLQQVLHKLRVRPMTREFYAFRKKQYTYWKEEALRRWKRLEKVQRGALFLDEKINTNFSMERMIYREKLGDQVASDQGRDPPV